MTTTDDGFAIIPLCRVRLPVYIRTTARFLELEQQEEEYKITFHFSTQLRILPKTNHGHIFINEKESKRTKTFDKQTCPNVEPNIMGK